MMFRRPAYLNFTSLAAWTAGSLAANRAHYEHPLTRTLVGRKETKIPDEVIRIRGILVRVQEEYNALGKALPQFKGDEPTKLTPFVSMYAYCRWFRTTSPDIEADIQGIGGPYAEGLRTMAREVETACARGEETLAHLIGEIGRKVPNPQAFEVRLNEMLATHKVDDATGRQEPFRGSSGFRVGLREEG